MHHPVTRSGVVRGRPRLPVVLLSALCGVNAGAGRRGGVCAVLCVQRFRAAVCVLPLSAVCAVLRGMMVHMAYVYVFYVVAHCCTLHTIHAQTADLPPLTF
jgi:hypothetical protein